jgi:hypothetical protein
MIADSAVPSGSRPTKLTSGIDDNSLLRGDRRSSAPVTVRAVCAAFLARP